MLFFAHGTDPQPLPWFVLLGDWTLAFVCLCMAAAFTKSALAPIFVELDEKKRAEMAGWVAIGLGILVATGVWITRQSVTEAVTPPSEDLKHQHTLGNGGQMVMWGDYHAELARNLSGEYRLWLTDAYQRSINSTFFHGRLVPRDAKTKVLDEKNAHDFEESLDHDYRFVLMPRETLSVQAQLVVPAGPINFNFIFDGKPGRHSMAGWCGLKLDPSSPPGSPTPQ